MPPRYVQPPLFFAGDLAEPKPDNRGLWSPSVDSDVEMEIEPPVSVSLIWIQYYDFQLIAVLQSRPLSPEDSRPPSPSWLLSPEDIGEPLPLPGDAELEAFLDDYPELVAPPHQRQHQHHGPPFHPRRLSASYLTAPAWICRYRTPTARSGSSHQSGSPWQRVVWDAGTLII